MNIAEALKQVRAFARQDGVILWLVWLVSFAMLRLSPQMALGNLLVLSTPFVVAWRLKVFRDDALDGAISFRRGLVYSFYTFFYASLLFGISQYVYFRFLDHGVLINFMTSAIDQFTPNYLNMGMTQQDVSLTKELLRTSTPIQLAFFFMMQNLLLGGLMSIPIAAVCMRRGARQGI